MWWLREGILSFATPDSVLNRSNALSLWHVTSRWGSWIVGWIAVTLTVVVAYRAIRSLERTGGAAASQVGIAGATAVLVAPHALFYDAGLAILAFAGLAGEFGPAAGPILSAVWIAAALDPLCRAALPLLTIILLVPLVAGNGWVGPFDSRRRTHEGAAT